MYATSGIGDRLGTSLIDLWLSGLFTSVLIYSGCCSSWGVCGEMGSLRLPRHVA